MTEGVKNYVHSNDTLLSRLKDSFELLINDLEVVSNRMKDISKIFDNLRAQSGNSQDNEVVVNTYKMMSNVMEKWGESNTMTKHLVESGCVEFFDYIKNELNCFRDVIF